MADWEHWIAFDDDLVDSAAPVVEMLLRRKRRQIGAEWSYTAPEILPWPVYQFRLASQPGANRLARWYQWHQ